MAIKRDKKILLTGGGTGGSVSPVLAIYESIINYELSITNYRFLWVGTENGIEKEMVENEDMDYVSIPSGKLRRYFSWRNFIDPIFILGGFLKSVYLVLKFRPSIVISAGSFVSVPVVWAAWLLGVPVLIHQQDVRPGLANKLMAPFADAITVTFEKSLDDYKKKGEWIGNFVRKQKTDNRKQDNFFNFNNDLPTILITGGGTGAMALNKLVEDGVEELTKFCNIIHLTGKDKTINYSLPTCLPDRQATNYKKFDFLNRNEMSEALQISDVVVTRAGLGTLTEIAYLEKPSIILPMPDSHQEDNAEIFADKKAALVLDQKKINAEEFVDNIKNLLQDKNKQKKFSENVSKVIKKGANERVVEIIEGIINK